MKHFKYLRLHIHPGGKKKKFKMVFFFLLSYDASKRICLCANVGMCLSGTCPLFSVKINVLGCAVRQRGETVIQKEIFDEIVFTYPSDPNDLNSEQWSRRALQSLHLQSSAV